MVNLVIDGREVQVTPGTKVIDAAEHAGITVPRFCYHPALGAVGACRVCAVKFEAGPLTGVHMSCMVTASDGMVVSTCDPEAVDFRRQVIEWLMLNHPHDCPVCDEGGHCLLQDLTVAGGHGRRRYRGRKRTFRNQELGPLLAHEMNRCIHCYRCARFYQEYCGGRDFGVLGLAGRTYFGRWRDGVLESPFAGNLQQLCPTGVFTDRPSRYQGRRWDFQRGEAICIHCSLGCNLTVSARYREVVRVEARFAAEINGWFVCDRGRYGYPYVNLAARPRQPLVNGDSVAEAAAMSAAAAGIRQAGAGAVGLVGSGRTSLESMAAMQLLAAELGWQRPAYCSDLAEMATLRKAAAALTAELAVSRQQVEEADFILLAGADPINEAPVLALALRQAARRGATVVAIDPRPLELPLDFHRVAAAPAELERLVRALGSGDEPALPAELHGVAAGLEAARSPVVIAGTGLWLPGLVAAAGELAASLQQSRGQAGLLCLFAGANDHAIGRLANDTTTLDELVAAIERGDIQVLVVVESDPFWWYPDRRRLEQALARLEMLVVVDYLPSATVGRAAVLLPCQTVYEAGGTYLNCQGRLQRSTPIFAGGEPLALTGGGSHPPRRYDLEVPGLGLRPGWQVLAQLGSLAGADDSRLQPEAIDTWIRALESWRPGSEAQAGGQGETVRDGAGGDWELIVAAATFGSEELSSWSPPLQELEKEPALLLGVESSDSLEVASGSRVRLYLPAGEVEIPGRVTAAVPPGVLLLPRQGGCGRKLPGTGRYRLPRTAIVKVGEATGS